MTPEQYWDGDPRLAKAYRLAHEMSNKALNEQLWLQGLYIYDGVGALLSDNKQKRQSYPKEPYKIFPESPAEKKAREQKEKEKVIHQLTAFKDAWDRKNG